MAILGTTEALDAKRGEILTQAKVGLVTGVSFGIGKATATFLLAQRGFTGVGYNPEAILGRAISGDMVIVPLDVRDESARSCNKTVLDRAGYIDALVNNAG